MNRKCWAVGHGAYADSCIHAIYTSKLSAEQAVVDAARSTWAAVRGAAPFPEPRLWERGAYDCWRLTVQPIIDPNDLGQHLLWIEEYDLDPPKPPS